MNNRAERAVRPIVITSKISGGRHPASGSTVFKKLAITILTLKLRDINFRTAGMSVLQTLLMCVRSYPFRRQATK